MESEKGIGCPEGQSLRRNLDHRACRERESCHDLKRHNRREGSRPPHNSCLRVEGSQTRYERGLLSSTRRSDPAGKKLRKRTTRGLVVPKEGPWRAGDWFRSKGKSFSARSEEEIE